LRSPLPLLFSPATFSSTCRKQIVTGRSNRKGEKDMQRAQWGDGSRLTENTWLKSRSARQLAAKCAWAATTDPSSAGIAADTESPCGTTAHAQQTENAEKRESEPEQGITSVGSRVGRIAARKKQSAASFFASCPSGNRAPTFGPPPPARPPRALDSMRCRGAAVASRLSDLTDVVQGSGSEVTPAGGRRARPETSVWTTSPQIETNSEGGVAGYFNRNMIFPNLATKTKGTFVKQYRKLVQPTASLFVAKLGRPPKKPRSAIYGDTRRARPGRNKPQSGRRLLWGRGSQRVS